MLELLFICALVMLASFTGKLAVWREGGTFVERNLDYLVSFSAGVFLVFLYGLASEATEHAASMREGLAWIGAGAIGIWLLFKIFPASHQHAHEHAEGGHRLDPRRLLVTDGIHNMADGIFLAASFAVSPVLAATAGVSIFVHEALQEISEFFVLREGGYSTRKALWLNFIVSGTILIGAIGGFYLLDTFEMLEAPLLGIAAGGLLVVVLTDLIPHSLRDSHSTAHYLRHFVYFLLGALLMWGLVSVLPHEEHGHEAHAMAYSRVV